MGFRVCSHGDVKASDRAPGEWHVPRVSCWLFPLGNSPGLSTLCPNDQLGSCREAGRVLEGSRCVSGGAEPPDLLQKQVREGQYGPGMAELEQQVAEHNILQKEIDAYGQQLRNLVGPVREPPTGLAEGAGDGGQGPEGPARGVRAPCTPPLTTFSPPWSRQDAPTIRSQYRDLLVSTGLGDIGGGGLGRQAWLPAHLLGPVLRGAAQPTCYLVSPHLSWSTEGGLVAWAEPGQPVHAPAGLHTPAERPGPAAAPHPAAGLERPHGGPRGPAAGV